MRLYVQWALATPQDGIAVELDTSGSRRRNFERLPSKPKPVGGEAIDDNPGWVYRLNIGGQEFNAFDHYAVAPLASGGIQVTVWNDDPDDFPVGMRHAQVWTIGPHTRSNTFVLLTYYTEPAYRRLLPAAMQTTGGPVTFLPYADFVPPAEAITRHGIWVPDELAVQHDVRKARHGWREWAV